MRARSLRPSFDQLDTRLVLDASGADMVCGTSVGASLVSNTLLNQQNSNQILDWYLPGTPPAVSTDNSTIEVPLDLLGSS